MHTSRSPAETCWPTAVCVNQDYISYLGMSFRIFEALATCVLSKHGGHVISRWRKPHSCPHTPTNELNKQGEVKDLGLEWQLLSILGEAESTLACLVGNPDEQEALLIAYLDRRVFRYDA